MQLPKSRLLAPSNKVPPKKIFDFITSQLRATAVAVSGSASEGYDSSIKARPCASYAELIHQLQEGKDGLHVDEGIHDTFATMVATTLGVKLGSLPIWLDVVGPASSGKTTLITALEAAYNLTFSISKFTGMFSGFVAKADPGMIPKVNGRCLLIKDLTPTLGSPDFRKIMGELRDIYDGRATAHYGNEMSYDYQNVNFGIITCVTEKIYELGNNLSDVGERFLRITIDKKWKPDGTHELYADRRERQNKAAVRGVLSGMLGTVCNDAPPPATRLHKSATWGLLNHLVDKVFNEQDFVRALADSFDPEGPMFRLCEALAEWVVVCRSRIARDRRDDITYRQNVENSARLTGQFTKLGVALCIVFDTVTPNADVLRIMRKVAFDTGWNYSLEILNRLSFKGFQSLEDLSSFLGLSQTQVDRQLEDLQLLGAVEYEKLSHYSGAGGRPYHSYKLKPRMRELANLLGIFEESSPLEPKAKVDWQSYLGIRKPVA